MSRSSKAVIIAATIVGLCLLWVCTGGIRDTIADRIKQSQTSEKAYSAAVEYYTGKYGTEPVITETEPVRIGKAGITFETVFSGYVVLHEKSCKIIYYNGKCYDNRQYDEICKAAEAAYFKDENIGSIVDCDIRLSFMEHTGVVCSYSESDNQNIDRENVISEYFDGDIDSFLSSIPHSMKAYVTYSGSAEKYGSYREMLDNKLNELKGVCDEAYLYVKDSSAEFEENAHYGENSRIKYIPTAHNYMEHIAVGHLSEEITVYQTLWHEIDEYTAVSDITSGNEHDSRDFIFAETDLYRGIKAVRRTKGYESDNVFVIDDAYYTDLRGKDIFLRLDREKYGINESTIPLIVYESSKYTEYETVSWKNEEIHDVSDSSWHYLDDKYLYLMLDGNTMKNSVLAFVQEEDMIKEKIRQ